jgi:hypothetical protein
MIFNNPFQEIAVILGLATIIGAIGQKLRPHIQKNQSFYEEAGAHVVLRPFSDAAEQGADALTYAMEVFPANIDWPVAFREIRLRSGSIYCGQRIKEIPFFVSGI